ncbi:MAG: hypothetical protein NVSMB38_43280 [Ktedonobacteraceae bacterium]
MVDEGKGQLTPILIESEDWYQWLTAEQNPSFAFQHPLGAFTVRRERKGSSWYWYAYRKRKGKLHKAYLGKAQEVTLQRLNVVAIALAGLDNDSKSLDTDAFARGIWLSQKSIPTSDHVSEDELQTHRRDSLPKTATALPAYLTPLLGREQEVQTVSSLLQRPEVRLVTLTGPGGIGKTRLGVQVATQLVPSFADGVAFVPLAPLSDPALVIPTITQVLRLRDTGDWSLFEHLKAFLRSRQLLLLLDNFEHLLQATPKLLELLTSCPGVKMLITSRAVLRARGEHEFQVSPLALPDLDHFPAHKSLFRYAAVALFLQRVGAIKPTFQLTATNARTIAEVCVKLEGLPLALELAAARIKLLSPQALLARLEDQLHLLTYGASDVSERQQTMRNTIRWSYELLSPTEQRLFRRVSVFVGGFTVEAAEYLYVALGASSMNVLNSLTSLLDNSLVQSVEQGGDEPRLFLLEAIREYGLECLMLNEEEEETRQAHFNYCVALLEKAGSHINGVDQRKWLDMLEKEHNNLRAALQWALERTNVEQALLLSGNLCWFWHLRGYQVEGRQWLDRVVARSDGATSSLLMKVLHGATRLTMLQSDFLATQTMAETMLAQCQEKGNRRYLAFALRRLGEVAEEKHHYAKAYSLLDESLQIFKALVSNQSSEPIKDIRRNFATGLVELGIMISYKGDFAKAHALANESLAIFHELNDRTGIIFGLGKSVKILIAEGEYARAYTLQEEAFSRAKALNHKCDATIWLHGLGEIALYQGDEAKGRQLLKETLALYTALGNQWRYAHMLLLLANLAACQGDFAEGRSFYEESLVLLRAIEDQEAIAALLENVAEVAIQKSLIWGVTLWGCAEALRETTGTPFSPMDYFPYKRSLAIAQTSLGKKVFADIWKEGRTKSYEQALALYSAPTKPVSISWIASSTSYPNDLSTREIEVLCLLAQGLTDAQIAEQLILSRRTISWHVSAIYRKIGISSRSAATHYAMKHHLI